MHRLSVAGLMTIAMTCGAAAETITVALDGSGDHDNIQNAIDAAVDGDEILVMPGTYYGSGDGWIFETDGKAIHLRSDQGADKTIIDGQNFYRCFVCRDYEGPDTIIDGFSFINGVIFPTDVDGNGTIEWWDQCGGGGLLYLDANPTIANCRFVGNTAAGGYNGGALGLLFYCSPTITNCSFENNSAPSDGGAIFASTWCNATLSGCSFEGNTAGGNGGAFKAGGRGTLIFESCTVRGNTAGNEGGGLFLGNCPTSLSFSMVCGNAPDQIASGDWDDVIGNLVADSCPVMGACCTTQCVEQASEADCLRFGGIWYGDGSVCDDITCDGGGGNDDCPADINGDDVVGVDDLLMLLSEFGNVCP